MVTYRELGAAGTLVVPFLAVLLSRAGWGPGLPAELPLPWGSTMDAATAFAVLALVCLLGPVFGLGSLRGMPRWRRRIFLVAGGIAGLACVAWLAVATCGAAGSADFGAWWVVALVACGYGLIPYFITWPSAEAAAR